MRRYFVCVLAISLFVPFDLQSNAEANAAVGARHSIQADYDHMDGAAARKDIHGVAAYDAPGYVSSSSKGSMGTAEQLRVTESFFRMAQSLQGRSTILSFRANGNMATVTVKRVQSFVLAVPDPRTGRHSQYMFNSLSRDTWLKGRSGWLRTASKRLSETVQKDGVLVR